MKGKITNIDAGNIENGRPHDRPAKSNWKLEMIKKSLRVVQHVSPETASKVIWHFFTKPGRSKFTDSQKSLLERAEINEISYLGHKIKTYRWGEHGPKILLSHGWRSKIVDFRKMIETLVEQGYVVEGIDMKAHGQSEGKHSALPEFRDILKNYYVKNGPFESVIGYSLGGIAAGLVLSEITPAIQPKNLFLIAAPPYVNYFFRDIVEEVGCNEKVYARFCDLVTKHYHQEVEYFDLRSKSPDLGHIDIHLIYDEEDQMVPFEKGQELKTAMPEANFVHTRGMGHYKIISHQEIIQYIESNLKPDLVIR